MTDTQPNLRRSRRLSGYAVQVLTAESYTHPRPRRQSAPPASGSGRNAR
jgi:hypothetical protein